LIVAAVAGWRGDCRGRHRAAGQPTLRRRRPRSRLPRATLAVITGSVYGWRPAHLNQRSGSSSPADDDVSTLLLGAGTCRDYAHLVTAAGPRHLRPLRRVYAPGP